MKALVYKSFCEMRYKLLLFPIGLLFAAVLLTGEYKFFFCVMAFFMAGAISMNVPYMDDRAHWNKYSDILPVSRKTVVSHTYFVALVLNTAMLVLVSVVRVIGLVINKMPVSALNIVEIIPAYLCGIAVISIVYFFVYKFSYNVAMVIYMFTCGAMGGAVGFVSGYTEDEASLGDLIIDSFSGEILEVYLIISVAAIAVSFISWFMAVKAYDKKEL